MRIFDRPLHLLHAHSAAEAWDQVTAHPDIAVGLIDVVMETPDAGLTLVRDLREKGYREMRLVLRTGQPGYAPELAVISAYEIDDYRTKDEITQTRLITVLTGAIRSFEHLRRISHNRAGLELIVKSANRLFQRTNFELFCQGVLTQVASLVGVEPHGVVCARSHTTDGGTACRVVSAVGRLHHTLGQGIEESLDPDIAALCRDTNEPNPIFRAGGIAFHFSSSVEGSLFVFVEADCEVAEEDVALLSLFSTNIAIGFENLSLIARLDRLAYIDPILEIPNLNAFEAALDVQRAKLAPAGRMALMSIDSYDTIVAVHGPHIAHMLLRAVYRTLMQDGNGLIAARIGDDTFALLGDADSLDAELVSRAIDKPYTIEGIEIAISATATLINLAEVATDPSEAMRSASSALLHVERTHRGQVLPYNTSMRADVDRRFGLLTALRRAVNSGEGLYVAPPTQDPPRHPPRRRGGGAAALEPRRRNGIARRVHPDRRIRRPHPATYRLRGRYRRPLGPRTHRAPTDADRHQPVDGRPQQSRLRAPPARPRRAGRAHARDHRVRGNRRRGDAERDVGDQPTPGAQERRLQDRPRRLRVRLFLARLLRPPADRHVEDRPRLRRAAHRRLGAPQPRGDRGQHGERLQRQLRRRRRGNRRAMPTARIPRLPGGARLLPRPPGADRRIRGEVLVGLTGQFPGN